MRELFIRAFQSWEISHKLRAPLNMWTAEARSTLYWLRPCCIVYKCVIIVKFVWKYR